MIEFLKKKVLPPRASGHYKGHVKIFIRRFVFEDDM